MKQHTNILADVEAFLGETGMTPTAFGKNAMGDPRFVPGLRNGRRLWPETEAKVRAFINSHTIQSAGAA